MPGGGLQYGRNTTYSISDVHEHGRALGERGQPPAPLHRQLDLSHAPRERNVDGLDRGGADDAVGVEDVARLEPLHRGHGAGVVNRGAVGRRIGSVLGDAQDPQARAQRRAVELLARDGEAPIQRAWIHAAAVHGASSRAEHPPSPRGRRPRGRIRSRRRPGRSRRDPVRAPPRARARRGPRPGPAPGSRPRTRRARRPPRRSARAAREPRRPDRANAVRGAARSAGSRPARTPPGAPRRAGRGRRARTGTPPPVQKATRLRAAALRARRGA